MILLSPFLLLFLLLLPGLWWLVRATPPQPRQQRFPSLVLLRGLVPTRQDAARTPLWLLLLRDAALLLLVLAFARPLYIPHQDSQPPQNLVLLIDDGWDAAPHWAERAQHALALGEATLRTGGHITLLTGAPEADGHMPPPLHPASRTALHQMLDHLSPRPWPENRQALARQLQQPDLQAVLHGATVFLLSSGLAQPGDAVLRTALRTARRRDDMRWPRCDLLRLAPRYDPVLTVQVETLPGCPDHTVPLLGMRLASKGQLTTMSTDHLPTGSPRKIAELFPGAGRPDALNLPTVAGPAGMALLPGTAGQPLVGLLHSSGDDTPLTGSSFYLLRALHSVTPYQEDDADALLHRHPGIVIATDGTLSGPTLPAMAAWVRHGGILIRFAGPDLARQSQQGLKGDDTALLPVPLLAGMRQLGGPMSWGTPQKLAPFPAGTPFSGLAVPEDATISRQLLAQPTDDLARHVWATLRDGTPLVTARQEGDGLVVFFHITPTADWSSLPLSGLFPQMLERLVTRAPLMRHGHDGSATTLAEILPPWRLLDMQKSLIPPSPAVRPLRKDAVQRVDALHPAGFYGGPAGHQPLNLADHQPPLTDEPAMGTLHQAGQMRPEQPLWPVLMLAALGLILLDGLLSLRRAGLLRLPRHVSPCIAGFLGGVAAGLLPVASLHAASLSPAAPQAVPPAALAIRLAHVQTGDSATDTAAQQGLEGLTRFLNQRSTTHLDSPVSVVPGRDDLAFYPLLYWPIIPGTRLDAAARAALKSYIDHNGMILIDEMGAGSALDGSDGHATRAALRAATEGLPIPPLTTLGEQHTLSHTFYLLHDYPGRITGQPVYVARQGNDDSETVSPVIIGNADWAHAWAVDGAGEHPFAVIPDGESQRTRAYRFGFNAIIYALTGNYKNDQRHYPEMLKRLKNDPGTDDGPSDESEAP